MFLLPDELNIQILGYLYYYEHFQLFSIQRNMVSWYLDTYSYTDHHLRTYSRTLCPSTHIYKSDRLWLRMIKKYLWFSNAPIHPDISSTPYCLIYQWIDPNENRGFSCSGFHKNLYKNQCSGTTVRGTRCKHTHTSHFPIHNWKCFIHKDQEHKLIGDPIFVYPQSCASQKK